MPISKEMIKNEDGSYTVKWKVPYKKESSKVKSLENLYVGPPCQVCSEPTRDAGSVYTYPVTTRTRICTKQHVVNEEIELVGAPTYIARF